MSTDSIDECHAKYIDRQLKVLNGCEYLDNGKQLHKNKFYVGMAPYYRTPIEVFNFIK